MLSLLSFVVASAFGKPMMLAQNPTPAEVASARQKIIDLNKMWGKARLAFDKDAFEKSLAPDFYVEFDGQKQTRKEFIDEITKQQPGAKFTRFDVDVLTVMKNGDHWDAVIGEKLEAEFTGQDGKAHHFYSYWVTRDGWKDQGGDKWQALYSIAAGHEAWRDQTPPIVGW